MTRPAQHQWWIVAIAPNPPYGFHEFARNATSRYARVVLFRPTRLKYDFRAILPMINRGMLGCQKDGNPTYAAGKSGLLEVSRRW